MRQTIEIFLFTTLFALCASVLANDSTARIGAGGLVFVKNRNIRMVSEKLIISPALVHVQYRFLNEGRAPIEALVAFPMPPFGWNPGVSAADENVGPIDSFTVLVDGHAVETKVERVALLGKRDITKQLRQAGLTDEQIFRTFADAKTTRGPEVPDAARKRLEHFRAVEGIFPKWVVAETAYWTQTFPIDHELQVEHAYEPLKGATFSTFNRTDKDNLPISVDPPVSSKWGDFVDRACLDEGARSAISRKVNSLIQKGAKSGGVSLNDVEYILGTGRNWKGPISDFTLDIVKEKADSVVSLCFPGKPVRVDDKTIRFHQTDFIPPDMLLVNFYSVFQY